VYFVKEYTDLSALGAAMKSKWRILGSVLGILIICASLFYLWVGYSLRRSFRLTFGPQSSTDIQDLSIVVKAEMGAFYLGRTSDLPPLNDGGIFPDKTHQMLRISAPLGCRYAAVSTRINFEYCLSGNVHNYPSFSAKDNCFRLVL